MFFLHKKTFNTEKRLYTHRLHTETFTNRLFCTQKLYPEQFYTAETFSYRSLYAQKKVCTAVFTDIRFLHKWFMHVDFVLIIHNYTIYGQTHLCREFWWNRDLSWSLHVVHVWSLLYMFVSESMDAQESARRLGKGENCDIPRIFRVPYSWKYLYSLYVSISLCVDSIWLNSKR
jgi:hypothetical protein